MTDLRVEPTFVKALCESSGVHAAGHGFVKNGIIRRHEFRGVSAKDFAGAATTMTTNRQASPLIQVMAGMNAHNKTWPAVSSS
jgi:hypothetical protein